MHLGYAANEMTQRGAQSDRMDALQQILARNEIRVDLGKIAAEIRALENEQAKQERQAAADREAKAREAAASAEGKRRLAEGAAAERAAQQRARTPAAEQAREKHGRGADQQERQPEPQQQAAASAQTQHATPTQPTPTPAPAERAKTDPTPAPQQWGMGLTFQHTPPGHVPVVPIEHIQARHAAAEAGRQSRGTPEQERLARAAAQEEARQRYERNEPYDQSRHRLSPGQQKQQETWQAQAAAHNSDRIRPGEVAARAVQTGRQAARSSFRVADRATGVVSSLGDFVGNLLSGSSPSPAPEKADMRRLATDPAYRRQHQLASHAEAQRRGMSEEAIDDIRRDIEAGRNLRASDVQKLTREHQEEILAKGDAYVTQMIEASRKRADEYWKGRERERD
jgi:hypothetical protein